MKKHPVTEPTKTPLDNSEIIFGSFNSPNPIPLLSSGKGSHPPYHPYSKTNLVERGGFEPPKASPTDLQSVPFGRSGTSPNRNHYFWIEQIPPGKEKDWEINELHKWNKDQHEFELIIFNKI